MRDVVIVTLSAALALAILAIYRMKRGLKISTYTLANGSWVLSWDAPTTGTPPFTYSYQVSWTNPNTKQVTILQSGKGLTSTNVILDPTKVTSQAGVTEWSPMSSFTFGASVTAVNSVGNGPSGSLEFSVYDTPSVVAMANPNFPPPNNVIYPTNKTSAFVNAGNGNYTIKSIYFQFADVVQKTDLDISLTYNNQTYKSSTTETEQEDSHWTMVWDSFPPIGPNQQVTLNVNVSNPAGKVSWSLPLTSPPPAPTAPSVPGGMNVKVVV